MTTNPWTEGEVRSEAVFQDDDLAVATTIVEMEYAGASAPVVCSCGGLAYYKATIGVMKCTSCGELYWEDGERIP